MNLRNIYSKVSLFLLLVCSNHTYASNLPYELLNAPIHLISGKTVSLADYKGQKPVYLKFWATWCRPCQKQMPHLEHIQKIYGDKIEIIAINLGINDDLEAVNNTIKEFNLTMPVAIDNSGDLAKKFRLVGTPYHLIFDENMNLIHQGNEADQPLDNKLSLLSQQKYSVAIDSNILIENEPDISINTDDGKIHILFFTATWCDWYLKDSRPLQPNVSDACTIAQKNVNQLYYMHPKYSWFGIVSRLWTGDKDLLEYRKNILSSIL
ncbi:TlpA disulfide reductase family protein [Pseudoalteromonas sp. S558]|jgi:thiol-disulfide isomerase/thioredoxin|uniref:TlpA disulfide reductase family protein n=1 Tax=Pseudoalteromonas sp. S558 TaxID=2066515 RepID=UPI00110AEE72|nr:TlpA disulfide reductase family protein [Pseudoalteromonas sp. S558]TMO01666.1 hypothetical protein CWB66_14665 [Pseudoalteromonas sp. S558]